MTGAVAAACDSCGMTSEPTVLIVLRGGRHDGHVHELSATEAARNTLELSSVENGEAVVDEYVPSGDSEEVAGRGVVAVWALWR
jgi:hypothetical protein